MYINCNSLPFSPFKANNVVEALAVSVQQLGQGLVGLGERELREHAWLEGGWWMAGAVGGMVGPCCCAWGRWVYMLQGTPKGRRNERHPKT
eukprot:1157899-Pelagomonas_calceolata.AAC.1